MRTVSCVHRILHAGTGIHNPLEVVVGVGEKLHLVVLEAGYLVAQNLVDLFHPVGDYLVDQNLVGDYLVDQNLVA
jgi:hypothetical protein